MEVIEKRDAWNKGKLVGQKPPLKPKDIWANASAFAAKSTSSNEPMRPYSTRRQRYCARSPTRVVSEVPAGPQALVSGSATY
jgi:hypothetical protein